MMEKLKCLIMFSLICATRKHIISYYYFFTFHQRVTYKKMRTRKWSRNNVSLHAYKVSCRRLFGILIKSNLISFRVLL